MQSPLDEIDRIKNLAMTNRICGVQYPFEDAVGEALRIAMTTELFACEEDVEYSVYLNLNIYTKTRVFDSDLHNKTYRLYRTINRLSSC